MSQRLTPKLVSVFREGYTLHDFGKDLTAGLIVGILALPMSIAFAIASGVKPEQGLFTAIVAGFLAGLLSGSRYQVTGPTGAFIILVADTYARYGYDGLILATILAGLILIAMGFARFGIAIKFIPYPVTIGFTSGIALLIFTTQIQDFFGMALTDPLPSGFLSKWVTYVQNVALIDLPTLAVSILSIVILLFWPRYITKIPAALVVIVASSVIVKAFNLPIMTIGDRYGQVAACFPCVTWPKITWEAISNVISPAFAIALLAGIESLLSAVVADGMTGRRHRSDMELISQGVANIGSALCGGIPATGAIARTATNIKSGAKSPVAALFHSITLLAILFYLGSFVSVIPMAALSAILMVVAYNMSEWRHFVHLFRSPIDDIVVLLVTFFLTVLVDLVTAIEVGVILAAFVFINRMAQATRTDDLKEGMLEEDDPKDYEALKEFEIPDEVEVFQIYGSLFFAAAEEFKNTLGSMQKKPRVLILRMRHVLSIDATGIRALSDILDEAKRNNTTILFSGVKGNVKSALERSGIVARVGPDNFHRNIGAALKHAQTPI